MMLFSSTAKSLRVVDSRNPEDRDYWVETWQRWSSREVHAHPGYVESFCDKGQVPLACIYQREEGGVLLPLIARPLNHEPWLDSSDERWDLVTPFGYGGPFAWGSPSEVEFWTSMADWASRRRIVGLTARLSLFDDQLLPFQGEVVEAMMNVVCDLRSTSDASWKNYAQKVRKNVRRARNSNLRCIVDETGSQLDAFIEIYHSTMERIDADTGFYFTREFFESLLQKLAGQFVFFHIEHEDRIISTELVLLSKHTMYSFLGGTSSEFFPLRPNDLLKHEAIEWGRDKGLHNFVLGGGYGFDDGIYKYKLAFAPDGPVPFKVGHLSFLPEEAEDLVQARRNSFLAEGKEWLPRKNFFPRYRS